MLRLFLLFATALAVDSTISGCTPSTIGTTGFLARFYSYGLRDTAGWEADFFSSGYQTELLHTVTEVTESNFDYSYEPNHVVINNYIYGYYTTISNITIELSAFYLAPSTGSFTFRLAADNGASLQFGSGEACCDDASGSVTGHFSIDTLGPAGGGGNTDVNVETATFDLTAGIYYPIKVVMFNWQGNGGIDLTMVDPAGDFIEDLGPYVFQATFEDSVCYTTITSVWTNSYTSTTTQSGTLTNTVVVEIPKATTTITSTWSNSYSTTNTVTGSSTNTVVVEVPTPTNTITSTWTESFTTLTTVTGGIGQNNTVIVNVPKTTTTITSTWSDSYTSTRTDPGSFTDTVIVEVPTPTQTVTTIWTGSYTTSTTISGGPGENNTVIVEVPGPEHSVTTTTRTWTGSEATTLTVTGSDTNTVIVEVPTPTQTVTTIWTGRYTTTTTVTGGPGENNTVIVEIPAYVTSTTRTWTGSYTTSFTVTGSDTNTVIVEVPTPTQTVTTIWTGSYTTSTTISGGPGENNTVIVEVPGPEHSVTTTTRTWTGSEATTLTVTGSDTNTVIVEVPTPTQTVTTIWTGRYTTTTTVTGGPGENNTVIVEIPAYVTSTTRTWTGSYTTSFTVTGSDTNTVIVEVPTPTQTVTTIWTGSYTTSTTISGGPGENNTVIVEVPGPEHSVSTTTRTWTGSEATTFTVTGSDTNTVIVEVPTPTQTVTTIWTGRYTTTTTVTGGPGENNTVIVEIPDLVSSVYNPGSGSGTSFQSKTSTSTILDTSEEIESKPYLSSVFVSSSSVTFSTLSVTQVSKPTRSVTLSTINSSSRFTYFGNSTIYGSHGCSKGCTMTTSAVLPPKVPTITSTYTVSTSTKETVRFVSGKTAGTDGPIGSLKDLENIDTPQPITTSKFKPDESTSKPGGIPGFSDKESSPAYTKKATGSSGATQCDDGKCITKSTKSMVVLTTKKTTLTAATDPPTVGNEVAQTKTFDSVTTSYMKTSSKKSIFKTSSHTKSATTEPVINVSDTEATDLATDKTNLVKSKPGKQTSAPTGSEVPDFKTELRSLTKSKSKHRMSDSTRTDSRTRDSFETASSGSILTSSTSVREATFDPTGKPVSETHIPTKQTSLSVSSKSVYFESISDMVSAMSASAKSASARSASVMSVSASHISAMSASANDATVSPALAEPSISSIQQGSASRPLVVFMMTVPILVMLL